MWSLGCSSPMALRNCKIKYLNGKNCELFWIAITWDGHTNPHRSICILVQILAHYQMPSITDMVFWNCLWYCCSSVAQSI